MTGRAADLMYTKLSGTLKAAKTFPNLAPYEQKLCFKPSIFLREACFRWCLATTTPPPRTGNRMQGRREAEWAPGQYFDPGAYH